MVLEINSIIAPIVTALCAFGGSWLAFSTRLTRVETKVDLLSGNVEKHNSMVERTYKLEVDEATMWRRQDELKDRLDKIEVEKVGGKK